jgi:methylenetetrahydrofolate dehydrogenase (NADP+) / methenyltetrahydrofolate cyclohydrolase
MITLMEAAPLVEKIKISLKLRVSDLQKNHAITPRLEVLLVGNDPASEIYVGRKVKAAVELGMISHLTRLPAETDPKEVKKLVDQWNADPLVHGILIQRPLPSTFKESEVLYWVIPEKDVDGFHPENFGKIPLGSKDGFVSCTPKGILDLVDFYGLELSGKIACVIGRSQNLGNPLAQLLLKRNATIIHCHSKTKDLPSLTKQADLLFVAIGKPEFIKAEHVKPGAAVIDVGIHRRADGSLCGDVEAKSVREIASHLSPVPGGVGPLTIFSLMENTIQAAELARP